MAAMDTEAATEGGKVVPVLSETVGAVGLVRHELSTEVME
jgi:hypothetical protein